MSVWVDIKYANLVSSKLERFKVKKHNPYSASFRCPICGDSKKSAIKARGSFYQSADSVYFKCFNCGATRSISSFLKQIEPNLYKEYVMENYVDNGPQTLKPLGSEETKTNYVVAPLSKLKKISQLPWNHPAKTYILNRKIPNEAHARLYYCSKFATWTNSIIPDKLKADKDNPRIIIPFIDEKGVVFGYQGRSLDPNDKVRYISIMLRTEKKVFGLNTVDFSKKHYVLEGPIDSLFLPNAIAMAGADIDFDLLNDKSVFVYDNECRNKEITKRMENVLNKGYKLCIWPESLQYKDINDMILGGMSVKKVVDIIDENTYNGPIGLMKLNMWKKT